MEKEIQQLKKGDVFIFNNKRYTVKRKYKDDNYPLKTECGELFHYEELIVIIPDKADQNPITN